LFEFSPSRAEVWAPYPPVISLPSRQEAVPSPFFDWMDSLSPFSFLFFFTFWFTRRLNSMSRRRHISSFVSSSNSEFPFFLVPDSPPSNFLRPLDALVFLAPSLRLRPAADSFFQSRLRSPTYPIFFLFIVISRRNSLLVPPFPEMFSFSGVFFRTPLIFLESFFPVREDDFPIVPSPMIFTFFPLLDRLLGFRDYIVSFFFGAFWRNLFLLLSRLPFFSVSSLWIVLVTRRPWLN